MNIFHEAPSSPLLIGVRADLAVIVMPMIKRMRELVSRMLLDIMAHLGTVTFFKLTPFSRCFVARATRNRSCRR